MGTDLAVIATYAAYGVLSLPHGLTFALLATAYAAPAALLIIRRTGAPR